MTALIFWAAMVTCGFVGAILTSRKDQLDMLAEVGQQLYTNACLALCTPFSSLYRRQAESLDTRHWLVFKHDLAILVLKICSTSGSRSFGTYTNLCMTQPYARLDFLLTWEDLLVLWQMEKMADAVASQIIKHAVVDTSVTLEVAYLISKAPSMQEVLGYLPILLPGLWTKVC
jgi:hypothetical protein